MISTSVEVCPFCRVPTDREVPAEPAESSVDRGALSPADSAAETPDFEAMRINLERERAVTPIPPIDGREPTGDFKDLRSYAGATRLMLAVWVLITGLIIGHNVTELRLLNRLETNIGLITFEQVEASDLRFTQIRILVVVGLVVSGLLFGAWLYRSYRNLDAFGHQRQFKAWWAWGGLFVPIWTLFRPRQIVGEIWTATDGGGRTRDTMLLNWWWGTWIIGSVGWGVGFSTETVSVDTLRRGIQVGTGQVAILGAAALLGFIVVGRVTGRLGEVAGLERRAPRFDPLLQHAVIVIAGLVVAVASFLAFDTPSAGDAIDASPGVYSGFGLSFPVPTGASVIEKGTFAEDPSESFGLVVAQEPGLSSIQSVEWFVLGEYSANELVDLVDELIAFAEMPIVDGESSSDEIGGRATAVRSGIIADPAGSAGIGLGVTWCESGRTVSVTILRMGQSASTAHRAVESVFGELTC